MRSSRVCAPALELDLHARVGNAYVEFIETMLRKAHAMIDTRVWSLSLALVPDALMAKLHLQFMNIAGPTDVLTFEMEHDASGRVTAGEVVICVPEARRQAKLRGTQVEHELLLYAIHGLLHLSGYDDLKDADYQAMHREEDRLLTALKIGPVFVPAAPTSVAKKTVRRRKKDGRVR